MKTSQFTVNSVGNPEPVICTLGCRTIVIGEDPSVAGWPTTDFRIKGAVPGSSFIQRPAGTMYQFQRISGQAAFSPGDIVGYVDVVTGSTTFFQAEM